MESEIKEISKGEIIRHNGKEYIIAYIKSTNGRESWEQPILKKFDGFIKKNMRKKVQLKKFKGIKLSNIK